MHDIICYLCLNANSGLGKRITWKFNVDPEILVVALVALALALLNADAKIIHIALNTIDLGLL